MKSAHQRRSSYPDVGKEYHRFFWKYRKKAQEVVDGWLAARLSWVRGICMTKANLLSYKKWTTQTSEPINPRKNDFRNSIQAEINAPPRSRRHRLKSQCLKLFFTNQTISLFFLSSIQMGLKPIMS